MVDSILSYERREEDDFYKLLGCDELSNTEQILAEYKIRALQLHPDKNTEAGNKFTLLQRAKTVLTDPELRKKYDQWLRCGLAISFDEWMSNRRTVHASMHWAGQPPKKPMLDQQEHKELSEAPAENLSEQKRGSLPEQFRSYKI